MIPLVSKKFNRIITKSNYFNVIRSLDLHSIQCSKCHNHNCFSVHCYYVRHVRYGPVLVKLIILRVKCSCCGITHAVLPYSIIPYTQRSLEDTIIIYDLIDSNTSFNHVLIADYPSISLSDLFILKRSFHLWKDVMASISTNDHPTEIFVSCFNMMHRNLSQIRYQPTDLIISI